MMMEVINTCQICQQMVPLKPLFELGEDVIKKVFVSEDYNEHALICNGCIETIEKLFKFKKTCLEVESSVRLLCNVNQNEAQVTIEYIVGIDCENQAFLDNFNICRICLESHKKSASIIPLAESNVKLMLGKCLPELNMDAVKEPVICEKCLYMLEQYFSTLQCLEDKKVKCEPIFDEETPVSCIDLKQEELEIKDDSIHNYLDLKIESKSNLMYPTMEVSECDKYNVLYVKEEQLTQEIDIKADAIENDDQIPVNVHIEKPTGIKSFTCNMCHKYFPEKRSLIRHIKTHTGEKSFLCETCQKRFKVKSSLTRHIQTHKGEKPFKCNKCEKQFTQRDNLKRHMRTHTDAKGFQCDICRKHFTLKNSLIEHIRIHTGERPYQCDVCGKYFRMKCIFMEHTKIHTGKRLFQCDRCDKRFPLKSTLTEHMRIHTGEKPFHCKVCDKWFTRRRDLKHHLKVHVGEKSFLCDTCDEYFSLKSSLLEHKRTHTGEKLFECAVCDEQFTHRKSLEVHLKIHTNEEWQMVI